MKSTVFIVCLKGCKLLKLTKSGKLFHTLISLTLLHLGLYNLYASPLVLETEENSKAPEFNFTSPKQIIFFAVFDVWVTVGAYKLVLADRTVAIICRMMIIRLAEWVSEWVVRILWRGVWQHNLHRVDPAAARQVANVTVANTWLSWWCSSSTSDSWSKGRWFDSRPGRYQVN